MKNAAGDDLNPVKPCGYLYFAVSVKRIQRSISPDQSPAALFEIAFGIGDWPRYWAAHAGCKEKRIPVACCTGHYRNEEPNLSCQYQSDTMDTVWLGALARRWRTPKRRTSDQREASVHRPMTL